jgi:Raf kinase inhibitor-like YbhB/YbcL family protein
MAFQLFSSAFADGGLIPKLLTCEGADLSPALEWSGAPEGTRGFALIVEDPDAPSGTWNHWLLYDIPSSTQGLPQGVGQASRPVPDRPGGLPYQGRNDFGKLGYGGPCPPKGHGPHRYFFKLYSLDVPTLGLPVGAARPELDRAIHGHVLAQAQYMGRYERR